MNWVTLGSLSCVLLVGLVACKPTGSPDQEPAARAVLSLAQALDGRGGGSAQDQLNVWQERLSPTLHRLVQTELKQGTLSVDTFSSLTLQLLGTDAAERSDPARVTWERLSLGPPFDRDRDGLLSVEELEVFLSRTGPVTPTLFEYERPLGPLRPVALPW